MEELGRSLIMDYVDLEAFFAEVVGDIPTETRQDVDKYPFISILVGDETGDFFSINVYPDEFGNMYEM